MSSVVGAPPARPGEQPPDALRERKERPHALRRLGRGDVHRERHEVAAQREHHLLGDRLARLVLRLRGRRAEVRRDDDVVEREQRRLGGRLLRERVDRGAAEPPVGDRVGERVFVDDAAPARVDQPHARASRARAPAALTRPIVSGVLVAWIVTKSQIATSSSIGRHELHAELAGAIGAHERVVRDEPHAERVRTLRDEHADAAEADDAERLAVQLDAFPLRAVPRGRPSRSAFACGTLRACASSSASVCSAAERMFDCGAFTTITPRRVASATSTLSRPMPARPTTTRSVPAASTSAVTWVALRITSAATPGIAAQQLLGREAGLDVDVEAGGAHRVEPALGEGFGDENA